MSFLIFIKKFYLKTNIHVALATTALVYISALNTGYDLATYMPVFVFFTTLWAYYFVRIFENCTCSYEVVVAYLSRQDLLNIILIFFSFLGSLYFGLRVGLDKMGWVLLSAILTLLYALPVFKFKKKTVYLRMFAWVKIISVALVWAIHTVIFPLQEHLADGQVWIEFLQRFFLIMALMIPFEIKDMNNEAIHISTLTSLYGITVAKKIGFMLMLMFFVISFLKTPIFGGQILSELFIFVLTLFFIKKAKPNTSYWFTGFWIDGVPIFWYVLLLLAQYFNL